MDTGFRRHQYEHYYKEYEMNAFNKSWDLALNKPWDNGGYENSSRVFKDRAFNMRPPLRSAVKYHPGGVINDPSYDKASP